MSSRSSQKLFRTTSSKLLLPLNKFEINFEIAVTCLRTGKSSPYVTSHPGQLSLAIPPWVGAMSTSESWGVNRHTARYTSPISVVSQCKLVSGWGLRKRRSAPPYGPCGSGRTTFLRYMSVLKYSIISTVSHRSTDIICQKLYTSASSYYTAIFASANCWNG